NIQESAVSGRSYSTRIGSLSASVATKCIDQMPIPIAKPPLTTQSFQLLECGSRTRAARSKVTCDAVTATRYDRNTSPRLKSFGISASCRPKGDATVAYSTPHTITFVRCNGCDIAWL